MDLLVHIALFVVVSIAIVIMSAFYAERDDALALASVPRRLGIFLGSCTVVAVVMLVCESLFASVG